MHSMSSSSLWQRSLTLLAAQWHHLTTFNASQRPWTMPFAAALASGLPLLIGVSMGHLDHGLIASLGGMVFLYLPDTPLHHRMVAVMASAFAMSACYALGMISHFYPPAMMAVLTFSAMLVTMLCRFYQVPPPGSLFFILPAVLGAYTPGTAEQVPLKVGLLTLGSLLACLIAFFYSLHRLRRVPPQPIRPLPPLSFDGVIFDSVVIGAFVGLSLAVAQLLALEKAYWAPVGCLAVIQGTSLGAVWNRQLHRVLGTTLGLGVAWVVLSMPLDPWRIALTMMALAFIVETLVVRHYGVAVIFITPLTILLAEAAQLGQADPSALIMSRFLDTLLGCMIGLIGGACLHSARFRKVVGRPLRWLVPQRWVP
jgi:hypothetical protein